jgi:hypothetical protein
MMLRDHSHIPLTQNVESALRSLRWTIVASVRGEHIHDFAARRGKCALLVRVSEDPDLSNLAALSAMLDAGDFNRAILICDGDHAAEPDKVETCRRGDLEQLALMLAAEARPA